MIPLNMETGSVRAEVPVFAEAHSAGGRYGARPRSPAVEMEFFLKRLTYFFAWSANKASTKGFMAAVLFSKICLTWAPLMKGAETMIFSIVTFT